MTHWQNFYHDATAEELNAYLESENQESAMPMISALQELRLSLESSMDSLMGR